MVRRNSALVAFVISFVLLLAFASLTPGRTRTVAAQGSPTCVPAPPGLVSWWPGDGHANDIRGVNNGILVGGAYQTGIVGLAFSFDGAGDFVHAGTTGIAGNDNYTYEAWVNVATLPQPYPSPDSAQGLFVVGEHGVAQQALTLENNWENIARYGFTAVSYDDAVNSAVHQGNLPHMQQWYHVAGVRDALANTLSLYIDGTRVAVGQLSSPDADYGATPIVLIGHRRGMGTFSGLIDEMSVYDRALSDAEILTIYHAGSAGKCSEAVQTVVIDIRPGDELNRINLHSRRPIAVAILTTDTFDAATVDGATVRFGATGSEAAPLRSALRDVDKDGDADRLFSFRIQDSGIECGDTSAFLTGATMSGQAIEGSDAIITVGCN